MNIFAFLLKKWLKSFPNYQKSLHNNYQLIHYWLIISALIFCSSYVGQVDLICDFLWLDTRSETSQTVGCCLWFLAASWVWITSVSVLTVALHKFVSALLRQNPHYPRSSPLWVIIGFQSTRPLTPLKHQSHCSQTDICCCGEGCQRRRRRL